MYLPEIRLTVKDDGVSKSLSEIAKRLETFLPCWKQVRKVVARAIASNFAQKRGPSGRWPRLAASTLKEKRKHGQKTDPLVATGRLKASLTKISQSATPDQFLVQDKKTFLFGTNLDYVKYHNRPQGLRGKRREVLGIMPRYATEIDNVLVKYLDNLIGETWES